MTFLFLWDVICAGNNACLTCRATMKLRVGENSSSAEVGPEVAKYYSLTAHYKVTRTHLRHEIVDTHLADKPHVLRAPLVQNAGADGGPLLLGHGRHGV